MSQSLTVYGRSIGDGAGAVVVTGSNPISGGSGASLTINGGKVTATGTLTTNANVNNLSTVTVNGGKLITGPGTGNGNGIGMQVTSLVINGGEVISKSRQDMVVNNNGVKGAVTVNGGSLTAAASQWNSYTNKIIFDGRKHLAYAAGITVSNTPKKAYDLPVTVSEQNGTAIDPSIIKVTSKKNKKAGTGTYKIKIKGKKYKALNKLLKSKEYKEKFKFEIGRMTLDAEKVVPALNKKGTKLK